MNYYDSIVKIVSQNIEIDLYRPYKTKREYEAIGTGFFIDNKGHILTCSHVVEDATKIWIIIPKIGKKKFEAVIMGVCPSEDLAVIKINDFKNKNYLKLGNSDKIKPNESVTAVGYPLGQDRLKFTKGVFSGRQGRLLQTDAPINPGNSGGPLIRDTDNTVIGINSSGIPSSAGENIGYAVPINIFNVLEKQLMDKKTKLVFSPIIGCEFNNSTTDMLKYKETNGECKTGYYISNVFKNSPLKDIAKKGDILCRFDKYKVDNYGECSVDWDNEKINIVDLLPRYKIGDTINVILWNKNKVVKNKITFSPKNNYDIRFVYPEFEKIRYTVFAGMVVVNLTLNLLLLLTKEKYEKLTSSFKTLLNYIFKKNRVQDILVVSHIFPGSSIKKTDVFQPGDILKSVNGTKVNTIDEYNKYLRKIVKKNGNKYMIFKNDDNEEIVLNLKDILNEEQVSSETYKYPLAKVYHHFK